MKTKSTYQRSSVLDNAMNMETKPNITSQRIEYVFFKSSFSFYMNMMGNVRPHTLKLFGKLLLILLVFLAFNPSSSAQLLSGLNYNYEVHSIGGWMNYNEGGSDEEVTWLTGACHDTDDANTYVIPGYTNVGGTSCSGQIWCDQLDGDFDGGLAHYWDRKLLVAPDKSDTEFDYQFRSWEDDGNRCVEDNDSNRGSTRGRRRATTLAAESSTWSASHTVSNSINNSDTKIKAAWRYTRGTKNQPIVFGEVDGQVWHQNANRPKPSGADNIIGYTDDWGNGDIDVTYEFTISGEAKNVRITTDWNHTDYNTFISLHEGSTRLVSNGDISSTNHNSTINRVLCPGTYIIQVEGEGSDRTGNFEIDVRTTAYSFDAGTISSSTNQTTACIMNKIETINGTAVPDLFDDEATYQWKVWDIANSAYVNVTSGTNTAQNLSNYGNMQEETLIFRRYATICGVEERTSPHVITYQPSSVLPGTIRYVKGGVTYDPVPPIRENTNTADFDLITSDGTDATGDPTPLTYRWESSTNETTWSFYGSAYGIEVPPLSETTWFRRIAINGCLSESEPSNSIKITILPANGEITGFVTAPPVGIGTGINNVMVCATPETPLDGAKEECVLTGANGTPGEYIIDDLYFGPDELNYIVKATLVDHDIIVPEDPQNPTDNDSTLTVRLTQQKPTSQQSQQPTNFIDTTVYTLDGNIYQTFLSVNYGKMGVLVKLVSANGIIEDSVRTDEFGNYSMIVPNAGVYDIIPELKTASGVSPEVAHTFIPAKLEDVAILGSMEDVDFEDNTTSQLISILQGPCNLKFGTVNFKLIDEETENGSTNGIDLEFVITKTTSISDLLLPARNYKVDVLEDTFAEVSVGINASDVEAQFTNIAPFLTDLTFGDTSISIIYKAPPSIEFEGIPELLACTNGSTFSHPILNQLEEYPDFKITVWEGPVSNACKQDTGFVKLINNGTESPQSFPISDGDVEGFRLIGGNPNIIAPYTQTLSIKAQSIVANNPKTRDTAFIVSGALPRGKTFFTQSPAVPLLILRDPPTDLGYSWYEANTSLAYRFKTQAKRSNINNDWANLKVGADLSISNGIGAEVGYNIAGWANLGGGSNGTTSKTSATETDMTMQLTQRYQTDDVLTGPEGDLYITGVLNFVYSKTDELLIDSSNCVARLDTSVAISPDSISSIAALTNTAVNNRITALEDLKANDSNTDEPRGIIFWDNQIQAFKNMQAENERLKKLAIDNGKENTGDFDTSPDFTGNIDYSGGSIFNREVTYDTLKSFIHEFLVEVENFTDINGGFEIMGNGLSGGNYIAIRTEQTPINPADAHKNTDTISQVSISTGFQLEDNEANDNFLIGVYKDESYGTAVFDLKGASTSCPYEIWDADDPRAMTDPFEVAPDPAFPVQRVGIDPATGVQYKFTIRNSGLFKAGYLVEPDLAYNENGAIITVNGSNTNGIVIDSLDPGEVITIGFTVKHDPAVQIFNHTIKMNIYAYCSYNFQPIRDNTNKKTLDFSVTFNSDCSRIDVITPTVNQVVNADNQGKLKIQMRNYDKSKLNRFFLQHKKTGEQQWTSSTTFDFLADKLFDDAAGTIKDWILPASLADGATDLRITTVCDGGLASGSEIVPIVVDLTKPEVFGLPSPIDDNYSLEENDQLSVNYTEAIMDNGSVQATIVDLITGDTIQPVMVDIFDNQIIVTPMQDLGLRDASLYRVSLSGVEDLNGNSADPYGWVFAVGDFDFSLAACIADLVVSNNNFNQNSITATNYNALRISSNGTITANTTPVMYNAQESVVFEAGFTVNTAAALEANIQNCLE